MTIEQQTPKYDRIIESGGFVMFGNDKERGRCGHYCLSEKEKNAAYQALAQLRSRGGWIEPAPDRGYWMKGPGFSAWVSNPVTLAQKFGLLPN